VNSLAHFRRRLDSAMTLSALTAHAADTIKVEICIRCPAPWQSAKQCPRGVMLMRIDEQNKKGGVLGKA
jgi:hypothetical protein